MGIPAPDAVVYLSVDVEVSQGLLAARYHGDAAKMDIQEKDTEYLAPLPRRRPNTARTSWAGGASTARARKTGKKIMRTPEDIHAEVLAQLGDIL